MLLMNTGMQVSVWVPAFNSLGYIPRSGIAGSYGNSITVWGTKSSLSKQNCLKVNFVLEMSHRLVWRLKFFFSDVWRSTVSSTFLNAMVNSQSLSYLTYRVNQLITNSFSRKRFVHLASRIQEPVVFFLSHLSSSLCWSLPISLSLSLSDFSRVPLGF